MRLGPGLLPVGRYTRRCGGLRLWCDVGVAFGGCQREDAVDADDASAYALWELAFAPALVEHVGQDWVRIGAVTSRGPDRTCSGCG